MIKFPPVGFGEAVATASMVPQPCPPDNIISLSQRCSLLSLPTVESMANPGESATIIPTIRIVGEYNSVSSTQSISTLNCI